MKYRKGEYCIAYKREGAYSFVRLVRQGYLFEYRGRQYGVAKERCDMPSKVVWVVTDVASGRQAGLNEYTRDRSVSMALRQLDRAHECGYFDTPEYIKMCEGFGTWPKVYK